MLRHPLAAAGEPIFPPEGFSFREMGADDVARSVDAPIRDCEWYGGDGAAGFALLDGDGRIACLQWYWFGERYRRAAFWPLTATEAASMHLVTVSDQRSTGLATALKGLSAEAMRRRGFTTLYSRIWWTNHASLRVSEKAGWVRVGTLLRLRAPGSPAGFALRWPA